MGEPKRLALLIVKILKQCWYVGERLAPRWIPSEKSIMLESRDVVTYAGRVVDCGVSFAVLHDNCRGCD